MGYIEEFLIDTKPGEPQDIGHKERYSEKVEEGGFPSQDCVQVYATAFRGIR